MPEVGNSSVEIADMSPSIKSCAYTVDFSDD